VCFHDFAMHASFENITNIYTYMNIMDWIHPMMMTLNRAVVKLKSHVKKKMQLTFLNLKHCIENICIESFSHPFISIDIAELLHCEFTN
jgi:hypothetical protein